jgi:hypothetical protein
MGRREGNPSNKSAHEHKNSLSQVTSWLSWFWDLERIWSLELCLRVNVIALVLNEDLRKLGCFEWRWLGIFIASNHFLTVGWLCYRWAHRTVTVHSPVCATSACPLGFGAVDRWNPLSFCCIGHVRRPLTSTTHCSPLYTFAVDRWRTCSRCSVGSPDSSVHTRQSGEL